MRKLINKKLTPEVIEERELIEAYITKLIKFTGAERVTIMKAIADELNSEQIIFDENNMEHLQYVTKFIKSLAFNYITKVFEDNLGSVFRLETINVSQFMFTDLQDSLSLTEQSLPTEIANAIRILS